jgi:hypothetical protein
MYCFSHIVFLLADEHSVFRHLSLRLFFLIAISLLLLAVLKLIPFCYLLRKDYFVQPTLTFFMLGMYLYSNETPLLNTGISVVTRGTSSSAPVAESTG